MKFLYEYRTSDNIRHQGVVAASNREAAFAALKAQGIRPGSLVEAPGFFNKLFGKGKRWIAIGVLAAACVTLAIAVGRVVLNAPQPSPVDDSLDSPIRRMPIGDTAVIEKGIATGWADVFALEGDRFLASFAIPGTEPAVRTTTEAKLREALHCPPSPLSSTSGSASLEARQIRAIVAGMKDELRSYLKAGGTIVGYGRRLTSRQDAEIGYYNRAKNEIEAAEKAGTDRTELLAVWERKNGELRNLGIRLVPMPK